jgi:tRNA A37 threonylcarbamoyladenosine synthetase subunit TsaC/SUA5/YrdC
MESDMYFSINSQNPQMRLIKKAADILRDGGVVIYPTDTVYGLGCDLFNKKGIESRGETGNSRSVLSVQI